MFRFAKIHLFDGIELSFFQKRTKIQRFRFEKCFFYRYIGCWYTEKTLFWQIFFFKNIAYHLKKVCTFAADFTSNRECIFLKMGCCRFHIFDGWDYTLCTCTDNADVGKSVFIVYPVFNFWIKLWIGGGFLKFWIFSFVAVFLSQ